MQVCVVPTRPPRKNKKNTSKGNKFIFQAIDGCLFFFRKHSAVFQQLPGKGTYTNQTQTTRLQGTRSAGSGGCIWNCARRGRRFLRDRCARRRLTGGARQSRWAIGCGRFFHFLRLASHGGKEIRESRNGWKGYMWTQKRISPTFTKK